MEIFTPQATTDATLYMLSKILDHECTVPVLEMNTGMSSVKKVITPNRPGAIVYLYDDCMHGIPRYEDAINNTLRTEITTDQFEKYNAVMDMSVEIAGSLRNRRGNVLSRDRIHYYSSEYHRDFTWTEITAGVLGHIYSTMLIRAATPSIISTIGWIMVDPKAGIAIHRNE